MKKIIVTEWMSLDGISDAGTMATWFNPYHSDSRAASIQETIHNCEVLLYGRKTYEMLYPYWSSMKNNEMGVADKLNTAKKYVVSTTLKEGPWENTTVISENIVKVLEAIKNEPGGDILVQGSAMLVKTLMAAGLVDELRLLVQPHIMGTGSADLFDGINNSLKLIHFELLGNGVVQLCYKPETNV